MASVWLWSHFYTFLPCNKQFAAQFSYCLNSFIFQHYVKCDTSRIKCSMCRWGTVTIWPWLLAQAIVQLTLTDTKTRFRCIWFIQKVYWMVYKNGGDGGGDGGHAPLLVWWVWCYLVYWFPDLNLVKNSVGTSKSNLVQFKSNNLSWWSCKLALFPH